MSSQFALNETVGRLRNISLFKKIADIPNALETIAGLFSTVQFKKGQAVIVEGQEKGVELYIIKSGTVEIAKKTLKGDDTYTVTELSAEMNIFFGELALLDPDKRSATVLCKTDCDFYVLKRDDFLALGDSNPAIGLELTRELSRILCNRLRKANTDVITLFGALVDEVAESGGLEQS